MEPVYLFNDQFPVYISKYVYQQPNERVVNVEIKVLKPFELNELKKSDSTKKEFKKSKDSKDKKDKPFGFK